MSILEPSPADPLFETPGNPVPEGSISGFVTTPDGINIRYARWEPTLHPCRGTVIILHGRTDCIEKYYETIGDMRRRGFGVLTFDWRGQGGSDRLLRDQRKGHVENFDQYLVDLETLLQEIALPDCKPPHYILGHSTGGLVALLASPALTNRIRRMVLVSPLLALNNLPIRQSWLKSILGTLTLIGLGRNYLARDRSPENQRQFAFNPLTSDSDRFERNRQIVASQKDLAISHPTIAWVFASLRAIERVTTPDFSTSISVPALLIAAGSDPVVSPQAIEKFGKELRSGSFLTIAGARHEILQEHDNYREQFLAAFDAFIQGTEA